MLPVLQLGPVAVPVPGLLLLLGVWVALGLAEKEAQRLQLDAEAIYTLAFSGLVAGLVGARLAYVARYWPIYARDPWGALSLNATALAPLEGALIGLLVAYLYGARRRLPGRATLDALAPAVALLLVALAGAHLASGDAFGAPTSLPWRVFMWGEYRHPSQVYALLAALAILALAWRVRSAGPFPGFNFLFVVALAAAARLGLEAFRGDSLVLPGGWRAAQLGAWVVLAACLGLMRAWASPPAAAGPAPGPVRPDSAG